MSSALPKLYASLKACVGAEILHETVSPSQVRFIVRIPRGQQTTQWLEVVRSLLQMEVNAPWNLDVSRNYFLMPNDIEDMRFRWRVILQGEDIATHDEAIAHRIQKAPRKANTQIMEVKLHGSPNRSRTAGLFGTVPIGQPTR